MGFAAGFSDEDLVDDFAVKLELQSLDAMVAQPDDERSPVVFSSVGTGVRYMRFNNQESRSAINSRDAVEEHR
jgi:hypothetical protein